jgi:hypothetical protein
MKTLQKLTTTGLICTLVMIAAPAVSNTSAETPPYSDAREWNFEVFLNDDPIGFHHFRLDPNANGYQLQTEAEFEVDFLFFTAYRYKHENLEIWENGCLQRIEARTIDNGDEFRVVGNREPGQFDLTATGNDESLEAECVRTFAYWDLDKLKDSRLLNAQTGEYVPVSVERVGQETIQINGKDVVADRYKVDAEELDLELWYTPEGEWLRLTSNVNNGRQLRYELKGS